MRRRTVSVGLLVCALLALPRPSHAGLIEFIWDMSGPQFIGAGFGCSFDTKWNRQSCRVGSAALAAEQVRVRALDAQPPKGPFLFLGVEGMVSTGKNSGGTDYKFHQAYRGAFTPGVSLGYGRRKGVSYYYGAGATWDLLVGDGFRAFDKFGLTATPIEAVFRDKYSVSFKIRLYPNSYTADEFGFGPRLDYDRPFEAAYGVAFSRIL